MGGFGKCSKIITFHLISRGEHSHKRSQSEKKNIFVLNGSHVLLFFVFCNVLSVCFCTGFFVVVPLQLTYLHGFQQFCLWTYFHFLFIVCVLLFIGVLILLRCPHPSIKKYLSWHVAITFAMLIYCACLDWFAVCILNI